MKHELPKLPYEINALEPFISAETLEFHYGKHHKTYVDNLNNLIIGTEFENISLEEIIKKAPAGGIFNNSAQVWNHSFYFLGLTSNSIKIPKKKTLELINRDFGNFENFKETFNKSAIGNFGSGWTWLVLNGDGKLEIINTSNAGTILTLAEKKPLLTCDVWEHAYYIDYRNARVKYLENFWNVVNWERIESLVLNK
ncbi:MAG: Fe-Mn family superoxide dismutase [Candidatus Gracilibacteria bacterium]|nr:Fe-Mn family superoxide dismutase [Candidatus Gracilibacteria bacterium]